MRVRSRRLLTHSMYRQPSSVSNKVSEDQRVIFDGSSSQLMTPRRSRNQFGDELEPRARVWPRS
jgi:hypothetical protein